MIEIIANNYKSFKTEDYFSYGETRNPSQLALYFQQPHVLSVETFLTQSLRASSLGFESAKKVLGLAFKGKCLSSCYCNLSLYKLDELVI